MKKIEPEVDRQEAFRTEQLTKLAASGLVTSEATVIKVGNLTDFFSNLNQVQRLTCFFYDRTSFEEDENLEQVVGEGRR